MTTQTFVSGKWSCFWFIHDQKNEYQDKGLSKVVEKREQ